MSFSVTKEVVKALEKAGVGFSFGIPGTHNIELYDVLCDSTQIKSILVTDEQSAGFMADGVSRASGRLAMVNLVPSAGLTHALSGIAEAYLDQVPMLILACGIRKDKDFSYQLHHINQIAVARPVTKEVFEVKKGEEVSFVIARATKLAMTPPCGPVLIEIPADLYLSLCHGVSGEQNVKEDLQPTTEKPQALEAPRDAICNCLNQAKNIGLYVGAGALETCDLLPQLADKLDAFVWTTISGKGVFPETNPRWAWMTLGRASPPEILTLEKKLDCLLAIGCRFGEVATGSYGFTPPRQLLHIDIDDTVFHKNYPATLTWQTSARQAVMGLLESPLLKGRAPHPSKLAELATAHQKILEQQGVVKSDRCYVTPAVLFNAVSRHFPTNTVYVTDSGNGTFLAMEHLRLSNPRSFLAPVDYSCMGYAVPAGIGAKLACPDRPVVVFPGDGAFLMTGLELLTAVQNRVGVVVFLLNDGELSQIAQFQKQSLVRAPLTQLPTYSTQSFAEAVGAYFLEMKNDENVDSIVREAYEVSSHHHPVLVEVRFDSSHSTFFTRGVIKTNFLRFAWKDRLRLATRFIGRKIF